MIVLKILQNIRQVHRCIFDLDRTALDSAHIQNIIDQTEQMLRMYGSFSDNPKQAFVVNMCASGESNHRIHRRTDIMRHIFRNAVFA